MPSSSSKISRQDQKIFVVRQGTLSFASYDGQVTPVDYEYLERMIKSVDIVVLDISFFKIKFSSVLFRYLKYTFKFLPVFFVISKNEDVEDTSWLTSFDRLVVTQELNTHRCHQVVVSDLSLETILEAVTNDVTNNIRCIDLSQKAVIGEDEQSASQETRFSGDLGRASAARLTEKTRHTTQVEALSGAIRRASLDMEPYTGRPTLLDYGCGVGRVAPTVEGRIAYHGIDISPSVIAEARRTFPHSAFYEPHELTSSCAPRFDIFLFVDVLSLNQGKGRVEIFKHCASLSKNNVRLILLEDFIQNEHQRSASLNLDIDSLLDDLSGGFGGTATLSLISLVGYKPYDYVREAAMLELDVRK